MSTKVAVWFTWAALAVAGIALLLGAAWWAWCIWAALVVGAAVLHTLAYRAGLM
ncbi:hypothetical protein ACOQFV_21040 [Nocardiopsis changdeensis]|uniref:DUF4175 domain-containing protein n=1 Tax=Nocardiopsis changdeensis TaxID=2831969 RepID=A0ABX8BIL5_9ACTN|nr:MULTISPECIES: hypothetical protein [Nocardiopsis]QUX20887.1 hypothetical protein KGD84_20725 [Nocardiopsis changdeensis]QYX36819.1 hypothetical protein K1J57_30180 [Nocardiopsis sp. MT53]